jgi:serine/threonine protein kinase
MMDVVCGLRHMHSRGVAHCDVKEANVLVTDDSRCIVSDYGLTCTYGAQCHLGCTFEYTAPEVCSLPALPLFATES